MVMQLSTPCAKSQYVWVTRGAASEVVESDSDTEDFKKPKNKKMKGTEGKEVTQSKQFVAAFEEEMEQICKRFVPKNTRNAQTGQ